MNSPQNKSQYPIELETRYEFEQYKGLLRWQTIHPTDVLEILPMPSDWQTNKDSANVVFNMLNAYCPKDEFRLVENKRVAIKGNKDYAN
jgi:hypothetical protein